MSKQEKKGLVPTLRFPEFRDAGEWGIKQLGNVAASITEKAGDKSYRLMSVTAGIGLVTQIEKFGKEIAGESYKNYYVINKGDFAYNKSSTKQHPEGQMALLENIDQGAVPNSIFTCFRVDKERVSPYFLKYPFANNIHGKWLRNFIAVGARANGALNVDTKDLLTLPIAFPSLKEQQKIADCLTSVDELITAQTQKLDALKTHKKGLMQQLFPAEGETMPRLRFPEFRDKGEWEEIELGQLGELVSGLTYSPDDIRDEGLLVLRSSNVQNGLIALEDNVFVRSDIKGANPSKPNDILICVRNGSKSLIGKNALIPEGMPPCTHGAFMTVFRSKSAKFIFQLFQTDAYERQVSADLGATINSINGNQLKKYKFHVPERGEQQKIADCLSSIDEMISNQAQKIEALKAHKKGLLQQLFPNPELSNL
jgi:type I restriction enzyme S subunit